MPDLWPVLRHTVCITDGKKLHGIKSDPEPTKNRPAPQHWLCGIIEEHVALSKRSYTEPDCESLKEPTALYRKNG